jgi:hypothetical protein
MASIGVYLVVGSACSWWPQLFPARSSRNDRPANRLEMDFLFKAPAMQMVDQQTTSKTHQ